jgi:hypothetical protein
LAKERLLPTGQCWCGCGDEAKIGRFFLPGHDKAAESAVIELLYGGVAEFIVEQGFGPGKRNPREELAASRARR